jgi:hypothetical protein
MGISNADIMSVDSAILKNPTEEALPKQRDAPKTAEIRAWLSLDGMASIHAPTPNTITVIRDAHTPAVPYFPKDAIDDTDSATLRPNKEEKATPIKLHIPPSRQAFLFERIPELIIPEIEFGASVNPFTNTTPRTSKNTKKPIGVSVILAK